MKWNVWNYFRFSIIRFGDIRTLRFQSCSWSRVTSWMSSSSDHRKRWNFFCPRRRAGTVRGEIASRRIRRYLRHCKNLNRDSPIVRECYTTSTVVVNNFITWVLRLNESPERAHSSLYVPDENIRASHGPLRAAYYSDRMINTRRGGRRNVYGLL